MTFTPEQTAALSGPLDRAHVKTRQQGSANVSYIEGWHAIAEANRIFGFDGWMRETMDTRCVFDGMRKTRNGDKPAASYVARVRVTVLVGDRCIIRDGTGAGSGFGNDAGEAHESAVKEAETDAMKRALMTFGNPFGLALYDKTQANVEAAPDPAEEARKAFARLKDQIGQVATVRALDTLMTGAAKTLEDMPEVGRNALMDLASKRRDEMEKAA